MSFVCQQCHRTFPDKQNQVEPETEARHANDGICPDCAEDDDDDKPSNPVKRQRQQGGRRGGQRNVQGVELGVLYPLVANFDTSALDEYEAALAADDTDVDAEEIVAELDSEPSSREGSVNDSSHSASREN